MPCKLLKLAMHKNPVVFKNCLQCGLTFQAKTSPSKNHRFCSHRCGAKFNQTSHGHTTKTSQSATYLSWTNMKARCSNPNNPLYPRYGGAGIKVCERWINSFPNFLADMGERPEKTTIDRINAKGDYTPENCKWSSIAEQQRNRKNNVYLAFNGKNQCLKDWATELGISSNTLSYRLKMQWPIEKILKPIRMTAV